MEEEEEELMDPLHMHAPPHRPTPVRATHCAPSHSLPTPNTPMLPNCTPSPLTHAHTGPHNTQCLALHDVGLTAKGVALTEKDQKPRKTVVDGIMNVYVAVGRL
jgi:hypothetical protein